MNAQRNELRSLTIKRGRNKKYGFVVTTIKRVPNFVPTADVPATQFIYRLDKEGNAANSGLCVGDYLLELNGIDVRSCSLKALKRLLRNLPETIILKVIHKSAITRRSGWGVRKIWRCMRSNSVLDRRVSYEGAIAKEVNLNESQRNKNSQGSVTGGNGAVVSKNERETAQRSGVQKKPPPAPPLPTNFNLLRPKAFPVTCADLLNQPMQFNSDMLGKGLEPFAAVHSKPAYVHEIDTRKKTVKVIFESELLTAVNQRREKLQCESGEVD